MTSAKNYETYILRDIMKEEVKSPGQLRAELFRQFGGDLLSEDLNFAVGYINGNAKVTIRSPADIDDVWRLSCSTSKEEGIVLWCEKTKKRSYISSDNESDEESERPKRRSKKKKISALEDKQNRVEGLTETLKKKHPDKFNTMQYRLWAEVLDAMGGIISRPK